MVHSTVAGSRKRGTARSFVAASGANLVANATWWMQPLLMHELVTSRGLGEVAAGIVISAEMGAMALASVLANRLLVGRSLHAVALAGTLLALFGSGLTLLVDGYGALLAARVVTGAGAGCALMMANAAATHFDDPDKTFARLAVGNIVFGIVLTGCIPYLTAAFGEVRPFVLTFASMVLLVPILLFMPRDLLVEAPHHAGGRTDPAALRNIAILALATFAIGCASGIMWVYYAMIGERLGLTLEQIDGAISMAIFSSLLAAALASAIGGRFGRVVPIGIGLAVLTGAILALSKTDSVTVFRGATMFNISAIYFLTPYLFGAGAAQDESGRGAVYVGSAFYFTGAIAPAAGGALSTSVGIGVMGIATLVICIAAFFGIVFVQRTARGGSSGSPGAGAQATVRA